MNIKEWKIPKISYLFKNHKMIIKELEKAKIILLLNQSSSLFKSQNLNMLDKDLKECNLIKNYRIQEKIL